MFQSRGRRLTMVSSKGLYVDVMMKNDLENRFYYLHIELLKKEDPKGVNLNDNEELKDG